MVSTFHPAWVLQQIRVEPGVVGSPTISVACLVSRASTSHNSAAALSGSRGGVIHLGLEVRGGWEVKVSPRPWLVLLRSHWSWGKRAFQGGGERPGSLLHGWKVMSH
jgi:hypothetical protein